MHDIQVTRKENMTLKPVQLPLSVEDVTEILHIALDEDPERALNFVKTVLAKQVEKALQRH
jgi:hypothetical protein